MQQMLRFICLLLALGMLAGLCLTGCVQKENIEGTTNTESTGQLQEQPTLELEPETEYMLPLEDGYNQVTFYWNSPNGYENCDMWIWFPNQDGKGHVFQKCEYGGKVIINVPEGIDEVGFIVRKDCSDPGGSSWGSAVKDYDQDRFAKIEGRETFVYLKSGDPNLYISNDGGKTLDMAKKLTSAVIADANKIRYRLNPKASISDLSQVKVFENGKQITVVNLSTLGTEAASGYVEVEGNLNRPAIAPI